MPIFCSIEPQETALRAPSEPSALSRNFGTTNSEMPLVPVGRAVDAREHEMDDVLGEVVLAGGDEDLGAGDRVAAVGLRLPPWCGSGRDRCRNAARSGSWCRSIRRRSSSAGRSPSALGVPCAMSAAIAPCVRPGYMANAMLAEARNSLTAVRQHVGRPWPPNSVGADMPIQPPSAVAGRPP